MAIETYADLEVQRHSDKVVLAELEPVVLLPPEWVYGEDLTSYDENDVVGDRLSATATEIAVTGLLRSEEAYINKLMGDNYFRWNHGKDFSVEFNFNISSMDDGGGIGFCAILGSDGSIQGNSGINISMSRSGSTYTTKLTVQGHSSSTTSLAPATDYWVTLFFDEGTGTYGTFWAYIYDDSDRTSLAATLAYSASSLFYYNYFSPVSSIETSGSAAVSGTFSNFTMCPDAWNISYTPTDTITLADGSTTTIRKHPQRVTEDGVKLSQADDIYSLSSASNSTFWDKRDNRLHLKTDQTDPNDYHYLLFFYLLFATKGIVLDRDEDDYFSDYYKPYISEKGVPKLKHKLSNLYWGVGTTTVGKLSLINNDGFFDQISRSYIWTNKAIRLLIGGEDLPYSEYELLYTGLMHNKKFSRNDFIIKIVSKAFDLLRPLPVNNYWSSNYANLDTLAEGRPIPIYYGVYDESQAPEVTCINTAYAANTYQFHICDVTHHAIKAITQVYINYEDGAGWQTISHSNESLADATFTIVAADYISGITRVKVAFESYHSGGTVIDGAPEIAEDIVLNWCGYISADLNAASFTASKALSDVSLNVQIESVQEAKKIIAKICLSDLAFFDEDASGLLRYRTWDPTETSGLDSYNDSDFIGVPTIEDDTEILYYKTAIDYSYQAATGNYLRKTAESEESGYKHEKFETLELETYLRGVSDATALAQRLLILLDTPSPVLKGVMGIKEILALLGDRIGVTMTRAPNADGGGYDDRTFEIGSKNISFYPLKVAIEGRDLKSLTENVGHWMDSGAPAWGSATERQASGFWCDANGYADPSADPDENSKDISRWW